MCTFLYNNTKSSLFVFLRNSDFFQRPTLKQSISERLQRDKNVTTVFPSHKSPLSEEHITSTFILYIHIFFVHAQNETKRIFIRVYNYALGTSIPFPLYTWQNTHYKCYRMHYVQGAAHIIPRYSNLSERNNTHILLSSIIGHHNSFEWPLCLCVVPQHTV